MKPFSGLWADQGWASTTAWLQTPALGHCVGCARSAPGTEGLAGTKLSDWALLPWCFYFFAGLRRRPGWGLVSSAVPSCPSLAYSPAWSASSFPFSPSFLQS